MQEYLPLRQKERTPTRGAGLRALALVAGGWVLMRAFFIIGDDGDIRLRPFPTALPNAAGIGDLAETHTPDGGGAHHGRVALSARSTLAQGRARNAKPWFDWPTTSLPHVLPSTLAPAALPTIDLDGVERDYLGQFGTLFFAGSPSGGDTKDRAEKVEATPLWPIGPAPMAQAASSPGPFGLYAYLFVRPDAAPGASATRYGGGQLFVRAHWRPGDGGLGGRSMLYVRASRDLTKNARAELAIGGAVQPVAAVPISVHGERRMRERGPDATAVFVSGGVSGVPLPQNTSLTAYAQGGQIWPDDGKSSRFFDGQASLTAPAHRAELWRADAGVLIATGGQDDAARLDIGPVVTVSAGQGQARVEGQLGWRFRVAGDAAPSSGPAITLSVGF